MAPSGRRRNYGRQGGINPSGPGLFPGGGQHPEPGAVAVDQPGSLHFSDFRRHGAALHPQVIGQRLPVVGDDKFGAPLLFGLLQKKGHQFFPGGFLRHTADFLRQCQVLLGHSLQQIADQPVCVTAGSWNGSDTEENDYAFTVGPNGFSVQAKGCAGVRYLLVKGVSNVQDVVLNGVRLRRVPAKQGVEPA